MKKIYLLSAVACMFAFNANAAEPFDDSGWGLLNAGTNITAEVTKGSVSTTLVKINVEAGDPGNQWKCQLVTPMWVAPGKEGDSFLLKFDVKYEGDEETGLFRIASGKTDPGYDGAFQGTNLYDPEGPTGNTQIVNEDGVPVVYAPNVDITKDWMTYQYDYFLGAQGADSVHLEIDLGEKKGSYYIKNVEVIVAGAVKYKYFTEEAAAPSAISETAVMKAYFANDVLYASEAADVVIYNINGVAVKSVKNAASVSVADLKSGLYIAKFGNATVKFVK